MIIFIIYNNIYKYMYEIKYIIDSNLYYIINRYRFYKMLYY